MAVAEITGRDEQSVDQLSAVVDPDALDALFEPRLNGTDRRGGRVSFDYAGFDVTVTDEEIRLDALDES